MDSIELKAIGFVCAAAMCITAMLCDGVTAIVMTIPVAAGIAGIVGYKAGQG